MRASYNIERIITNGTKINVKRMRRCGLLECIFLRLDWPPTHQRGKVGTYVVNHTEQFMLLLNFQFLDYLGANVRHCVCGDGKLCEEPRDNPQQLPRV